MRAGGLRHKLSFETVTETRDSYGGVTETWAESFTEFGSILGLLGKEYFDAQQVQSTVTHKIRVRHNDNTSAVTTKYRIKHVEDSVYYNIHSAIPDARKSEVIIMASEVIT